MSGFSRGSLRLYYERRAKSYLLVDHCLSGAEQALLQGETNGYEAIGETLLENDPNKPCLGSTSVSWQHLNSKCRRTSWAELPKVWQDSLGAWVEGSPLDHKGLWHTGETKVMKTPRHELPLLMGTLKGPALKVLEQRIKGELP